MRTLTAILQKSFDDQILAPELNNLSTDFLSILCAMTGVELITPHIMGIVVTPDGFIAARGRGHDAFIVMGDKESFISNLNSMHDHFNWPEEERAEMLARFQALREDIRPNPIFDKMPESDDYSLPPFDLPNFTS